MRKRYVQALDLSPGFSDFERRAEHVLGVGCESDDRKGFMGGLGMRTMETVFRCVRAHRNVFILNNHGTVR
jgi:hypothetical protein